MSNFSNNTISLNDSKRLKESFFNSTENKKNNNRKRNKIIIATAIVLMIIVAAALFALKNFDIIILPQYKSIRSQKDINLLNNKYTSSINLLNARPGSKITKNGVLIEAPSGTKAGLSVTLRDKIDFSNSRLILVINNPEYNFRIFAVLRDTNFFSNADSPIEINASPSNSNTSYVEIPIDINNDINADIKRVNQLRLTFYQKKTYLLPLLIKKVYLERR